MNFYKHFSVVTGAILIPILPAWAGVEKRTQPADPPSGAVATPIQLVKRLAIDSIRQSDLAVQAASADLQRVSASPQRILPGSLSRPSQVLTHCPAHICPPVDPLLFPTVGGPKVKSDRGLAVVQPPQVGGAKFTNDANTLLPSPTVSEPDSTTLDRLGVSNAADILREHENALQAQAQQPLPVNASTPPISAPDAADRPPLFSSGTILNFVNNLTKTWDVHSIAQQFVGMQKGVTIQSQQLIGSIHQTSASNTLLQKDVLIDRAGLFLPVTRSQPSWMKVPPAPDQQFNPRLTLGSNELAMANMEVARPTKAPHFLLASLVSPQREPLLISQVLLPDR